LWKLWNALFPPAVLETMAEYEAFAKG
jgi:hypothetical protein